MKDASHPHQNQKARQPEVRQEKQLGQSLQRLLERERREEKVNLLIALAVVMIVFGALLCSRQEPKMLLEWFSR